MTGFKGEKLLVDLCNTEEQMSSMTVLQLKQKIADRLPGNSGKINFNGGGNCRLCLKDVVGLRLGAQAKLTKDDLLFIIG